jgi:hypothetical protein
VSALRILNFVIIFLDNFFITELWGETFNRKLLAKNN